MKVTSEIYVNGTALWVPEGLYQADDAVANGVISGPDARGEGIEALPVSTGETAPEMAAEACAVALAAAGKQPHEVDALVYAWVFRQGTGVATPAHRVARLLGADRCVALGVQQMSNGGAAALELAVARLLTEPTCRTAVVATGDEFRDLPYDRWRAAPPLGDGATAVVLTREPGEQIIRSVVSVGEPALELEFPGRDPFAPLTDAPVSPFGHPEAVRGFRRCVGTAVGRALEETGLTADDPGISAVLPTRGGRSQLRHLITAGLPTPLRAKVRQLGVKTGHVGAGDLIANLAEQGAPAEGRHHVLVSIAGGMTVTAVVTSGTR